MGMLKKNESSVTGTMYPATCFIIDVVLMWMRYECGEQMAKCRSKVNATIMRTEAHIETCANTSRNCATS